MGIFFIIVLWVLIAVAQTLFTANGNFEAGPRIVNMLEADYACSAVLSLFIVSTIAIAIFRIWKSLAAFPQLRRNESIMWLHLIVIFFYAMTLISNSILVSGAKRNSDKITKWVYAFQIQGIIQAWFSFLANVILLYILDHISKSMVEEQKNHPYPQRDSADISKLTFRSESAESRSSAHLSAKEMERYMSPEHTMLEVSGQGHLSFGFNQEIEQPRNGID